MSFHESRPIGPQDFLDRFERRVLTDAGTPGMDGNAGSGSTTEIYLASIAGALNAHAPQLDHAQLDDIIRWVDMYKRS